MSDIEPQPLIFESQPTGRNAEEYCQTFSLTPESIKGKRILDVGSGTSDFYKFVAESGGELICLEPSLLSDNRSTQVKGVMQRLPFEEGTFDETLSNHALFNAKDKDNPYDPRYSNQALKEMIRVTKEGGWIKVAPIFPKSRSYSPPPNDKLQDMGQPFPYFKSSILKDGQMHVEQKQDLSRNGASGKLFFKKGTPEEIKQIEDWIEKNAYLHDPSEWNPYDANFEYKPPKE